MSGDLLDGKALLLAAAKGSVAGERLTDLVDRAAIHLEPDEYRRSYECVYEDDSAVVLLVENGHWADIAAEIGLCEREAAALRRAHEEHLLQLGSKLNRRQEFERALDLRDVVTVPKETP